MNVTGLRCLVCGAAYPFTPQAYLCPECRYGNLSGDPGILDVEYDYQAAAGRLAEDLASTLSGVFRYRAVLPTDGHDDLLPVGATPLIDASRLGRELGVGRLLLKDETRNPTRCLKDRATAVGTSLALEVGQRQLYCASAGNAAISLAGFAAHLGLQAHVFVPSYASEERLSWLRRYGADITVSGGDYDTAVEESEQIGRTEGWFSRNCAYNPFLVEGKKTAAWEIAEGCGWQVPDMVVAPVGDGCTLAALGKGFRECLTLGLSDRVPRMVGAQADSMQPAVERWLGNQETDPDRISGSTEAASINVRYPRNARRLMAELRLADGTMLAVTDEEIAEAQLRLSREAGVVVEFTSAAGLAAVQQLALGGELADQTVVVVLTGGRVD